MAYARTNFQERHGHCSGGKRTPTYMSWCAMKERCYRRGADAYSRYGAVGVAVCEQWLCSFSAFLGDMGLRPEGKTLHRLDNALGYQPGNCVWATAKEQCRNRRSCWPLRRKKAAQKAARIAAEVAQITAAASA
jgi:hypothetical protein